MTQTITQSESKRNFAAQQTHTDPHAGHGVIAMPTHDDIARRAYDIYVKDGRRTGHCKQNWHQAEHDLRAAGKRA